ncbi:MAG: hypothetical protein IPO18_04255 [bacterium]|nr:hypothetical protein [bacterium]
MNKRTTISGAPAALLALALAVAVAGFATTATALEARPDTIPGHRGTYYFYRGLDYGSQSLVHPLRLIVNGGFGIMQIENRSNRPGDIRYGTGARNVLDNLAHPQWAISTGGFWDFFKREVLPVSVSTGGAQYWPNYMNHLLGGGMSYRMMEEYFRYHGVEHSKAWAGATIFAYHFLNEVVENDGYVGPNVDPVADFWIFNPAGVWLFSHEGVARFFSEKLNMADWSYQPVWLPESGELHNNGQNYMVKFHLTSDRRHSLFYHWGSHAELGLSYTDTRGRCISAGLGLRARNLLEIDNLSKTVDLAVSGGIFYDRDNSLLASLLFARSKDYRYRLNIYPGLIKVGGLQPGFFVGVNADERMLAGITIGTLRHVPVGVGGDFFETQ